jgi:hypothetical protein
VQGAACCAHRARDIGLTGGLHLSHDRFTRWVFHRKQRAQTACANSVRKQRAVLGVGARSVYI